MLQNVSVESKLTPSSDRGIQTRKWLFLNDEVVEPQRNINCRFLLCKRLIITTNLENSYKTYSSCKVPSQVNIIIVRESIPRRVDKKFGVPEEEKGVWGSQS